MKKMITAAVLTLAMTGQTAFAGSNSQSDKNVLALIIAGAVTTAIVASALDNDKVRVERRHTPPPPPPPRWSHHRQGHHWRDWRHNRFEHRNRHWDRDWNRDRRHDSGWRH